MLFLLDTNILIAMSKQRPGLVDRLEGVPADAILLSSVVVAEIEYGIAKSGRRQHNRRVFDTLLAGFQVVPFDAAAARLYGPIRADLEKRGRLIGSYDLLIAAHAKSVDAVLVTDNAKEFDRVAGLRTVNWLA
ncbi:MAG: type II toxin-antitoxin system tRNA(fMet)-specific endonuclease VapC [Pirellulales bacterium]